MCRRGKLRHVRLARDLRWRLNAHLKDRLAPHRDRLGAYLTIGGKHLKEVDLHFSSPNSERTVPTLVVRPASPSASPDSMA